MVYAAPPLRARPPEVVLTGEVACLAARGGLGGGEGTPELTSGIPLCPASPRSGVVKASESRGGGVHDVGTGADIGRRTAAAITTTTTASFTGGIRHCYDFATVAGGVGVVELKFEERLRPEPG